MDFTIDILMLIFRSVVAVLFLFLVSRILGPRQISQLTFYDYIVGISIGSIAAVAVERDVDLLDMIISMLVFGGFAFLFSYITDKSLTLRRWFSGKPTILIYNGKILKTEMNKKRYDMNDLLLNLREQGYFKIEDIAFAILETNGGLSVMPKSEKAPLTPYDMAMTVEKADLEYNLIIDGEVLLENLKYYGKDEQWLNKKLNEQNVKSAKEVLLCTGDSSNNIKVFLKNEALPHNHFFM